MGTKHVAALLVGVCAEHSRVFTRHSHVLCCVVLCVFTTVFICGGIPSSSTLARRVRVVREKALAAQTKPPASEHNQCECVHGGRTGGRFMLYSYTQAHTDFEYRKTRVPLDQRDEHASGSMI